MQESAKKTKQINFLNKTVLSFAFILTNFKTNPYYVYILIYVNKSGLIHKMIDSSCHCPDDAIHLE